MALSDWQSKRLRNALSAYHSYRDPVDNRAFNWKDVAEAIAEANGLEQVPVSPERLRQFVEGNNTPDGRRKYPEPKNIEAVITFATHQDYRLLSRDELREFQPDWHAALRLLEYLDQGFDADRLPPPASLEGTYEGERTTEEALVLSALTLHGGSRQGMIQAVQTDDFFDLGIQTVRSIPAKDRVKARRGAQRRYGGWAILTPEDTLLLFMKDERYRRNHYYFTLASDLSRATNAPVMRLTCLYHDYGLEAGEDGPFAAGMFSPAMALVLQNNIVTFERAERAGG